jgi:hypothetical protein
MCAIFTVWLDSDMSLSLVLAGPQIKQFRTGLRALASIGAVLESTKYAFLSACINLAPCHSTVRP